MHRPLRTPDPIKVKAVELLRLLNGLSYADALFVLDVAKRTMDDAVERLQVEQIFTPPAFRNCLPTSRVDRPSTDGEASANGN